MNNSILRTRRLDYSILNINVIKTEYKPELALQFGPYMLKDQYFYRV